MLKGFLSWVCLLLTCVSGYPDGLKTWERQPGDRIFGLDETMTIIYGAPYLRIHKHITGPLLTVDDTPSLRGRYNISTRLTFNCKALFSDDNFTDPQLQYEFNAFKENGYRQLVWPPPEHLPSKLLNAYLMDGRAALWYWRFVEKQNGGNGYDWPKELIEKEGKEPLTCGLYNSPNCKLVVDKYASEYIKNKRGLVLGSQTPWVESALVVAGAEKITTIEYMTIHTTHPKLDYIHPFNLSVMFNDGKTKYKLSWVYHESTSPFIFILQEHLTNPISHGHIVPLNTRAWDATEIR